MKRLAAFFVHQGAHVIIAALTAILAIGAMAQRLKDTSARVDELEKNAITVREYQVINERLDRIEQKIDGLYFPRTK